MSHTVNWDQVEALWVLDLLYPEKLPQLACDALAPNDLATVLTELACQRGESRGGALPVVRPINPQKPEGADAVTILREHCNPRGCLADESVDGNPRIV